MNYWMLAAIVLGLLLLGGLAYAGWFFWQVTFRG